MSITPPPCPRVPTVSAEPLLQVDEALLDALHARLVPVFASVTDWARPWTHPASGRWTLDTLLAMYAWHGRHHAAQITGLRGRLGN